MPKEPTLTKLQNDPRIKTFTCIGVDERGQKAAFFSYTNMKGQQTQVSYDAKKLRQQEQEVRSEWKAGKLDPIYAERTLKELQKANAAFSGQSNSCSAPSV